jgi:hypothetical protein
VPALRDATAPANLIVDVAIDSVSALAPIALLVICQSVLITNRREFFKPLAVARSALRRTAIATMAEKLASVWPNPLLVRLKF